MRKSINNRIHFTYGIDTREILLEGNRISDKQVEEIYNVWRNHIIPMQSQRYFYESIVFSIANQRMRYEGVMKFMDKIHALSDEQLRDPEQVYQTAINGNNRLWFLENRFEPSYSYIEKNGGIEEFVQSYFTKPNEIRRALDNEVKWLGLKTASLWYLCLGGTDNIICLDVHNTIQSKGLGIDVSENNYIPKERKNGISKGKKIHNQIEGKEYLRVERELAEIFKNSKLAERYPEYFINEKGELNGSFVSALLWWQGTQGYRGKHAAQLTLFDDMPRFRNPFKPIG